MGEGTWPYIVRQGDYLAKIALRTGYAADVLWDHPRNAPLRRAGRTPDVLHPGDVIHVPEGKPIRPEVTLGGDNAYEGVVPRVPVRLVFKLGSEPRAGQAYEVRAAGETLAKGDADGDGAIAFEVPVDVMDVTVTFAEPFAVYPVRVGHVDPVCERSGAIGRLRQLGYLPRSGLSSDEEVSEAFGRFQQDQRLAVTGAPDEDTQARLAREFGS